MKALFNYIKARINTNIPTIKTVRMWNNQLLHSNGSDGKTSRVKGYRDEKAFPYPACFVEFIVEQSDNRCMGIVDYILTVRFRFGLEAYKFERLDSFDFADTFKSFLQLMAPTVASGLIFTTFQEISTEFDEDHDNVESPYIDYRTRYRSIVAYQRRTDIVKSGVSPSVDGIIVEDINADLTFDSSLITMDSDLVTFDQG